MYIYFAPEVEVRAIQLIGCSSPIHPQTSDSWRFGLTIQLSRNSTSHFDIWSFLG